MAASHHYHPAGVADEDASWLAAMVDCSSDAIIAATLSGVVTGWSAGAAELYGYAPAEMVGHNLAELGPADQAGGLGPVLAEAGLGKPAQRYDTVGVRQDGSRVDVSVLVRPFRAAGGAVTGVVVAARDVSDRNRVAAEDCAMRARLHRMERLETLGQLAGGLAHDVNNLLGVIVGFAGLVADDTSAQPAVRDDVTQICVAADRAAALTKQLLTFARREPAPPQPLDLNAVVTGVHGLLEVGLGGHVRLRLDTDAGLPPIQADHGQVEQVLLNLAVNARDAMPDGGTLTIRTAAVVLGGADAAWWPGLTPGRYVRLSVCDTGVGMSPDVAAHAFEPFFTTKDLGQGTGLGLPTVHEIVTGAGGAVRAEPAPGGGTVFTVYFPAGPAEAMPVPRAGHQSGPGVETGAGRAAAGGQPSVLVVDDQPEVLAMTARILRRSGFDVARAQSGAEALDLLASREFDLLLTDSVMPGISGMELAERARRLRPGQRVLCMSGYSAEVLDKLHRSGDASLPFLQKPFTADTLVGNVREVLAGRAAAAVTGEPR